MLLACMTADCISFSILKSQFPWQDVISNNTLCLSLVILLTVTLKVALCSFRETKNCNIYNIN